MSNKVRVSVLLEPETVSLLEKEAKDKSISLSAVIRQKVVGINVGFSIDAKDPLIKLNKPKPSDVKRGVS